MFAAGLKRATQLQHELYQLVAQLPSLSSDGTAAGSVDIDDINAVVKLKQHAAAEAEGATWQSIRDEVATYRVALFAHLEPSAKLEILLSWAEDNSIVWTNDVKAELVRALVDGLRTNDRAIFAAAWRRVRSGELRLDADALAESDFARYVLFDAERPKTKRVEEEVDLGDEYDRNPRIVPAEAFLVSLAFHSDATDERVALRISQECDARLMYQPSAAPTRLSGELLGQIHRLERRDMSPAVQHRRNIGLVFRNARSMAYCYDPTVPIDVVVFGGIFGGQGVSIELPHLVYALVDRVEIDVAALEHERECEAHLSIVASPGIEVLRTKYRDDIERWALASSAPMMTLSADVKGGKPCSHVSVGVSDMTRIRAVRVFGRAIVF